MTDLLLPGCDVPARRRSPDELVASSLIRMTDESLPDGIRLIGIEACWIRGGAAASAAEWLIAKPSSFRNGLVRVADGIGWAGQATRSEYLVGICYVMAIKGLPVELRYRAAAELVSHCFEAGYAEARRLLPKTGWSWLIDVQEEGWASLISMEFIADLTAPLKTRAAVAAAFLQHVPEPVIPSGIDELIRSAKVASADRLRLAANVAKLVPEQGRVFLAELVGDRATQPLHKVQAAEELTVDAVAGQDALHALAADRQIPPAARELARRSLDLLA
ncbi:hypothetical protein ACIBEJ_51910 [Nonomuraea sp. NPDC050790]|uniref:hypothetical protein n=1 Tax=Nonomuraea sp. NPDC050790 TaxID=3364371 RepID=UPI00378C6935